MKIARNSNGYPTSNAVRQALLLPVPQNAEDRAKAAIGTILGRTGSALEAPAVFTGAQLPPVIPGFCRG